MLGIALTPFVGTQRGEVHAVSDIADMALLGEVATPDVGKHLLGNLTVEPTDTIDFLTSVAGKSTHAELLAVVIGVLTTHTDELIPRDTKHLGIAAHVLAEETFLKVVVASRNGRVHGI